MGIIGTLPLHDLPESILNRAIAEDHAFSSLEKARLLIHATRVGCRATLRELAAVIPVDERLEDGSTALMFATDNQYLPVVEEMILLGASVHAIDHYAQTALEHAISSWRPGRLASESVMMELLYLYVDIAYF